MRQFNRVILGLSLTLLVLGGLMWALSASARSLADGTLWLPPLTIDDTTHHLGDQTISFFDVPTPTGTAYEITFTLPISAVQDSFLRLETYNVQGHNPVMLNGVEVERLPGTWWVGWQPTALSVPGAALQAGTNTLLISSTRFTHWQLFENWYDDFMFRDVELLAPQVPLSDEFDGVELDPRWDWVDLLGDCTYSLAAEPGALTLEVPGALFTNQGHDLFWLANFNTPRLLQPVRGDFVIETRVSVDPGHNYQAAGLLVWQDTWHHVRLERNAWWGGSVFGGVHSGQGVPWTFRLTDATELELRLSRVGNTFVGWYREPGAPDWTVLGRATSSFSDTVLIGLAAYNQWTLHPMSAAFEYFNVSQVVPPLFTSPCGTTNQTQPVVRGLATAGVQVDLYADGAPVATTTATVEGTFALSPTVPLSPGAHTLTATVTSGSETSPASPPLSLTVAPSETIDLVGVTIVHMPLFGGGSPVTSYLRNRDGCAACDGSGFNVWVPGSKPITVSVPVSATDVTSVTVRIAATDYVLDDADADGVYEGSFTPPAIRGAASLAFIVHRAGGLVIEYTCGEIIIDPYGTVYDAALGLDAPISGAVVTLYQQDPATQAWRLWTPTQGQENPQTTGSDGRYAFNVVEGMYYLTVEAAGYMSYTSQPIEVSTETGPVELMIPLDRNKTSEVYLPLIMR